MTDERWLSDWLLGEGSAEQRRQMESRLAADPELRERARRLEAVTGRLHDLPPAAWEAIVDQGAHPAPRPRRARRRRRLRPAIPRSALTGLAAGILFAVGLGVGELVHGSSGTPVTTQAPAQTVALAPLAGAPARSAGVAYLSGRSDDLQLDVTHLPAIDSGHYYEAWLMSSSRRLIPLASFRVDARGGARLELALPAAVGDYRYIDISLQRVGAGTEHSHRSLLRGPTVAGTVP
ncbi:MAG: anti-sigma factor domain-containing protein [Solirubrobacteraceae bacterium]